MRVRVETLWLAGILLLAGALRFTGLGQGIPYAVGVDEPEIVERAVNMMRSGEFNPRFFDYPGLYIYLQFGVAVLRFVTGAMSGLWATLDQAPTSEFYLWGRAVTALLGTATVGLVILIARRLGLLAAVAAGLFLALQPMHARESHYVLTDVPMAFFVTLTLALTLRAGDRRTLGAYAWCGVAAGCAAATKYNGGIAMLLPLLALAMQHDHPRRFASAMVVVGAAGAAFLIAAPYTILDLPAFLNAFGTLSHMYAVGQPPPEPGWLIYLKHLRINLGWPGIIVAIASLGVAVVRTWQAPTSEKITWATASAFVVITFWLIARQKLIFGRYLLSILPPLAVLMGGAVAWALARLGGSRWTASRQAIAAAALILLIAYQPAATAVGWARLNARVSTEEQLYAWLVEHVPAGSRVAVETFAMRLPPDRWPSSNHPRLIERTADEYAADGYHFLLASSQSFGPPLTNPRPDDATRAYRTLFDRLDLVTTLSPSKEHPGAEWRIYRLPR
ncbi:MAG TPA: phospholipid carrier-dependent glycosyltransferase [Vicinamibacterales bacterium]|nr:phospholipid carrier-dependent glycosyltransferase [Vicinamibacterales bacterium]